MPGVQGITLGYGGNPYGPAGTGKTESVKALGQALARQVALTLLVCCASDVHVGFAGIVPLHCTCCGLHLI